MKKILYILAVLALISNTVPTQAQNIKSNTNVAFTTIKLKNTPKSIDCLVGNYNNKIKIIFSDIDGTILRLDKKSAKAEVPEQLKQSVQKLHNANIPLVLTTGRAYVEASEIAKKIGNDNTYVITQQGSEITNPKGQIIYQDGIKDKDVYTILKDLESFKKSNKLTSKVVVFVDGKLYATEKFSLPYNWADVTVLKSFKDIGKNFTSSAICIYETDPVKIRLIQAHLKTDFPNYHIDLSTDCYCDITSATATKGNAVKKLAGILGIDLKNAATFGDAENDISMLKKVRESGGLSIAVGNAMDKLKENADYVTSPVLECGFSKAIDKILENNRELGLTSNEIMH